MILVLSPSKTLDFESKPLIAAHTLPAMLPDSQALINELRKYPAKKLSKLMDISDKLAALNAQRYQDFKTPFTASNAKQALLAFKGDVYEGVQVENYTKDDFAFAQDHLRMLSGLYGLLKPLDLIQPYRLEMSTRLRNPRGNDLYHFWGERITQLINRDLKPAKHKLLLNLASEEYFKAVRPKALDGEIINVVFKEKQKGKLKIIGLFAKKARGMMASFVVKNRITDLEDIKEFKAGGYKFMPSLSDEKDYVFAR